MVTSLCDRVCPDCCNNQYDLNTIPYVTHEELQNAEEIYITGGEPFIYSNPCNIAKKYKNLYKNIKKIIVYTNAMELGSYLTNDGELSYIDGLTISIKSTLDVLTFNRYIRKNPIVRSLSKNVFIYVFPQFKDKIIYDNKNFTFKEREWQKDFKPNPNSIFRKI
jgi:molybdenum cofactor biosynthesis enzyme MoaA